MPPSLQNGLTHVRETWEHLPKRARFVIPLIAVAILGGLIGLSIWSGGDEWTELFTGLSATNLMNVRAYIEEHTPIVPRIDRKTNSVLVPRDMAPALRLQILYDDVIVGEDGDLLDVSQSSLLTTPEEVRQKQQRMAERKLQETIESLRPVARAHVNLTLAREGVFIGDDQPAKAAVSLKLHPGQKLSQEQIDAIYKLIVHSVAGLSRENVTVLDSNGNLLLSDAGSQSRMDTTLSHWEYQQQQARDLERKIKEVLAPVVGSERDIRVGVHVESDFDQTELTKRTYINEDQVVLSEETSDETAQGSLNQGLPPGTSSNVVTDANVAGGNSAGPVTIQRQKNRKEYQPSVEETKTISATGKIKRITAAVNINAIKPWTAEELSQFEELVKTAIGYNQQRGDLVTVSSFAFRTPATPQSRSALDRVLVYLPDLAKYAVIGLLGFLLLMLLRSVMNTLHVGEPVEAGVLTGEEPVALGPSESGSLEERAAEVPEAEDAGALPGETPADLEMGEALAPQQVELQNLQKMVERMVHEDPEVILRVIEGWLNEDPGDLDLIVEDEE